MQVFKRRVIFIFLIFICASLEIQLSPVYAGEVNYSVRAIIPENQLDKQQTYFDLRMKPGQKEVINVEIFNSSNEDTNINVYITNPITTRNGLIDYSKTNARTDKSLKVPITEIATIEKNTVKVPARGSRVVPIQLVMPEEEFDGIILGGIYFEKIPKQEETKVIQIKNKYSYVLGLKLSETDKEIKPKLYLKSVKPGLVNYHTAVIANIQNSEPVMVGYLKINAKVYNSTGKEINKVNVENYQMAPNSVMPFPIDWHNKELTPGKYKLKLHAVYGKQSWNWTKEFVIQDKEAQHLNKQAVEIQKEPINFTLYVILGLSLIIIILVAIIFKLTRKNRQQNKQR